MTLRTRCTSTLVLLIGAILGAPAVVHAEPPPPTLMQQGRVVQSGAPLEGTHDIAFRLYQDTNANQLLDAGEPEVYLEQSQVAFRDGYYAVVLGLAGSHDLPAQIIAAGPVLLTVAIDGGAELAAQPVTAVPYAFVARHVEGSVSVSGGGTFECTGCLDAGTMFGPDVIDGSHIAPDSVAREDIGTGAVASDELADGSITPDDVAGALYATKADLYMRETAQSVSSGSISVTASCTDTDDIAIAWECDTGPVNSTLDLKGVTTSNWTSTTSAASVRCDVSHTGGASATLRARIFCSPVP